MDCINLSILEIPLVFKCFIKALPIIPPLEYVVASLKLFLSEIPNPVIKGFFKFILKVLVT